MTAHFTAPALRCVNQLIMLSHSMHTMRATSIMNLPRTSMLRCVTASPLIHHLPHLHRHHINSSISTAHTLAAASNTRLYTALTRNRFTPSILIAATRCPTVASSLTSASVAHTSFTTAASFSSAFHTRSYLHASDTGDDDDMEEAAHDEYDDADHDPSREYEEAEYESSTPAAQVNKGSKGRGGPGNKYSGTVRSEGYGSTGGPILRVKRPARGPSLYESKNKSDLTGVTLVENRAAALRVLEILDRPDVMKRFHAVDTEVMQIDVRNESPVGHGIVTCISIYCGPDVDFGTGPRLWIDTLDQKIPQQDGSVIIEEGTGEEILNMFKGYLENPSILKVWHNYSFDRHVLANHGIHCKGFGGDTMHMARLENAARDKYALEVLSEDFLKQRKRPMKELFSMPKLKKDNTPGKTQELPPVEVIQRDAKFLRSHWIQYSCYDTESTWQIREVLEKRLRRVEWLPPVGDADPNAPPAAGRSMFDFYIKYWRPFGELLCDLETEGIWVDAKDFLPKVEIQAEADKVKYVEIFKTWVMNQQPEAKDMNIHSATQKQHLFFASVGSQRKFKTENTDGYIESDSKSQKPKKQKEFILTGLGMPITDTTEKKMPAVSLKVLKKLAGKVSSDDDAPPKYGTAYSYFGRGESGALACQAIDALCKVSAVNIMLNTFIKPLQYQTDSAGRIHCSLNLNTETGRLSSRKPNLQNQPALEKDIYKIRAAFAAIPGKKLIVADYGQLELRILAHFANCRSMIEAFELGGDFHSRTAMGMYPHVAQAVANGTVLLEWDKAKHDGAPPTLPMLKDVYAAERRKAKTLNFSIAYGKTARGLSLDWGVSLQEANETLAAWYRDRPEVKEWQETTIAYAHEHGRTVTLMGRHRPLPFINSRNISEKKHSERAAINTPIQGGAADVVMKAMLKLHEEPRFKELGWKILLQIHDEIIAEGPEESAEEALKIVKYTMSNPFNKPLRVELVVDAKIGTTWYEAK